MACVIAVQALVFSDGGLVVMGANIFNMGVVGTLGGFAIYLALCRVLGGEDRARIPASAIAAWIAVVLASIAMSLELIVSGTSPAEIVLPAMLGVHVFVGIGEALITAAALAFIAATRRDLLDLRPDRAAALARRTDGPEIKGVVGASGSDRGRPAMTGKEPVTPAPDPADSPTPISTPPRGRIGRRWWAIGVAIAALVVIVLAPLASSDPDGLERVAEDQGFLERAQNLLLGSPRRLRDPRHRQRGAVQGAGRPRRRPDRGRDRAHPRANRRAPPRPGLGAPPPGA